MEELKIDCQKTTEDICQFLKRELKQRNKTRAVLGISGGVDSAVVAILCQKAGLDLQAIFMPYGKLSQPKRVKMLTKNFFEVDITEVVNHQIKLIEKRTGISLDKVDKGNIMARTRMIIQYALARKLDGLVVGTENLSEYYLGYFTFHGDQACDINPIAGLFKTQVMELAKYLGVPAEILNQKPSAELYEGQTDEKELGFSYREADPILHLYCCSRLSPGRVIKDFGFDAELVNKVVKRVQATEYKRQEAPKHEIY